MAVSSPPARAAQTTALTVTGLRSERRDGMHASEGYGGWQMNVRAEPERRALRASICVNLLCTQGSCQASLGDREGTGG
ncbi:hypothetical protein GCM10010416_35850 [Streptomyces caniferus]